MSDLMTHPQPKAARGSWAMRDYPLVAWLLAGLSVAIAHQWIDDADWVLLHIVLLGALTQGIVVWSWHFAQTLLHTSNAPGGRRHQTWRLALLNGGATLVLIGVPTHEWWMTLVGGTIVAGAAGWHGWALWGDAAPRLARPVPGKRPLLPGFGRVTDARRRSGRVARSSRGRSPARAGARRPCAHERAWLGGPDPDWHPAHVVADDAAHTHGRPRGALDQDRAPDLRGGTSPGRGRGAARLVVGRGHRGWVGTWPR